MKRIAIKPRENYGEKLESIGLSFWAWDNYWKEDVCYQFTSAQIDMIEEVTEALHAMCITAVKHVIDHGKFHLFGIPAEFHEEIRQSFYREDFSLYGRFDLAYDGVNPPKMLEYNADTPTSILETAVAQWYWLEDRIKSEGRDIDQFNSLHEKLVERWKKYPGKNIHFGIIPSSDSSFEEDWVATTYLMETAVQAGKRVVQIGMENIGWNGRDFVDLDNQPINHLFKLYPWEWMMREEFSKNIRFSKTQFIEPIWKSLLSCKAILPILWELFPDHPNLLECHFDGPYGMKSYAKKPLYSREGANIVLVQDNEILQSGFDQDYGKEGYIYQELFSIPNMGGKYPVIGSWIVGDNAAGMCIREDVAPITTNLSNFVPHYFCD